jgi:hypothetical protein|uniref:NLP/P60 family protein, Water/P60 FAMILY PROTEIN, STRUCTURAL GENOMICS: PG4, DGL.79A n=1 Tax=Podoviridae sp. cti7t8 TaxID=2823560 RepID=A0A8S5LFA8_9CAUD|nr:MAG TPA: NLP/P60 family protein, Water/P60 FAMILY PROTEIN, STRUCTURAL GENOMICS: PG4, DGL.79A [Podoviridae sp. cti7t8]DAK11984.1 MAG TPA: NLP/P60 family protein, Water/P60 FAMILY PROTEIN, STRUCTURAL GENOMICS [Caudoviricetes sp.]
MAKHEGAFGYTNDWRRRDPERYGWGDCSSTIAQAYLQCAGIRLGERSFNIAAEGRSIAYTHTWRDLDLDTLRAADVICMGWATGPFAGRISHVELYAGGGYTWGHGGPGRGPRFHRLSDPSLTGSASIIAVRRFIEDDSEEDDLTPDQANKLDWIYSNLKVPEQSFGYPQATQNSLGDLQETVNKLTATVEQLRGFLEVPGYGFGYPAASHHALEEIINKLDGNAKKDA